jgi:hypothetical protein
MTLTVPVKEPKPPELLKVIVLFVGSTRFSVPLPEKFPENMAAVLPLVTTTVVPVTLTGFAMVNPLRYSIPPPRVRVPVPADALLPNVT